MTTSRNPFGITSATRALSFLVIGLCVAGNHVARAAEAEPALA